MRANRRVPWWRNPAVLITIAAIALAAVGGGALVALVTQHTPASTPVSGNGASAGQSATEQGGPPCPLTGTASPSHRIPDRPALAVKIDNYPAARPQAGLDRADIVFEEPVEGGITRLVAVFQCQEASLVGPVRSARQPDVGIVDELSDPILVHVGGIDPVLSLIRAANDTEMDLGAYPSITQHPSGRVAPFDTYVSTADVWQQFPAELSAPSPIFDYSTGASGGSPVLSAQVPFSSTNDNTWTWNPSTRSWQLSIGGAPAMLSDGSQISVANVVIMTVDVSEGPWVENAEGAHEVEVNPTGSGAVEVLRNGVAINGTWQRSLLSQPPVLEEAGGNNLTLAPGETWVELVPASVTVTTSTTSTTSTLP